MPDTVMPLSVTTPAEAALLPTRPLAPAARVGLYGWIAFAVLLLFAGAMTRSVSYDEDQYIAAGVLARHLLPYRDFMYLQGPLYPLVLAALFTVADGWFLLAGRLLTFALSVGSGVLLWHLLRRLGAGIPLAVALVTACLASPFLTAPMANTRNDMLPLFLMLAGLSVHLWSVERSWWGRVAAALLFGLAAEAKVSYLFGPLCLGIHALFAPRSRLPPFVLGTAAAAAPAAFFYIAAPEAFRFGVFEFHLRGPEYWYTIEGQAELLTPWSKLVALADYASFGGNLSLLVLCVALSMVAMARHRKWKRPGRLLLGMTATAGLLAFMPSPSWAMYYAALPPLLACCVAHLDRTTTFLADATRKQVLVGVALLPAIPFLLLQSVEIAHLAHPARWVGLMAHDSASNIRSMLPEDGEVATLFPIAVLDANPIPPAFATGPFMFRSGSLYSPAQLARLHSVSPDTVAAMLDRAPPMGIYGGLYAGAWKTSMDAALVAYAESHGWRLALTDAQGGRLWVRH